MTLTHQRHIIWLIELKGTKIDRAYKQIESSIIYLESNDSNLIHNNFVNAYIVSPSRQKLPRGGDLSERCLAKKIRNLCKIKQGSMIDRIKYVIIKPCTNIILKVVSQ